MKSANLFVVWRTTSVDTHYSSGAMHVALTARDRNIINKIDAY